MGSLDGKVYLVTGGAGALAEAIAEVYTAEGAKLALIDRAAGRLDERAARFKALALTADLSAPESCAAAVSDTLVHYGRLDGLIHTVGGFHWGRVHEAPPEIYERMFDLNVRTLYNMVRAVLPILLGQCDGFIAGISSMTAWRGGSPGTALYTASKAAVTAFLRSLDPELQGTDIRIAIAYPMGSIDTPANRMETPDADPDGFIDPLEIAQTLAFAASRGPRGRLLDLPIHPRR